jgi:ribosomal protein S18 acetylase RimI-like enzyme
MNLSVAKESWSTCHQVYAGTDFDRRDSPVSFQHGARRRTVWRGDGPGERVRDVAEERSMSTREGEPRVVQGIAPLSAVDVPRLHMTGNARVDETDILAVLARQPTGSFWVPETGEFILVAPWRNRPELPSVNMLWSFRHDDPLIEAAVAAAAERGCAGLVMIETGERRQPAFYHRHGFSRIEIIRTYEHAEPRVLARHADPSAQRFVRITHATSELLPGVTALDHAAFPWFWWNSAEEFASYLLLPGVELWAGVRDDEIVSYFGFTTFHHWAHLDRIAVAPGKQGLGLGRSALGFAAQRMIANKASRIGLSTQNANRVSRNLYESLGFRHTRQSDYDVFGVVLDAGRVYAPAGAAPRAHES